MLKIVHKICCGIDVHKKFVVATIGTTNEAGTTEYQTKKFSTFTVNLLALRKWLVQHSCREVCMESTGKYCAVFNILETECNVVVANPKYSKVSAARKPTKEIPFGFATCTSMDWFLTASFLRWSFVKSGI